MVVSRKVKLVLCVVVFIAFFQLIISWQGSGGPYTKPAPIPPNIPKPPPQQPRPHEKPNTRYIVGIISHRPKELKNLLASLEKAKMDSSLVYIWDDSPSHLAEIDDLIREYNLNEVDKSFCTDEAALLNQRGGPLTAKYWCLFEYLFVKVPGDVQATIFLEDDLIVSPDFFTFFEQMFPIMMEDSSTWCISAWNDNGWPAVVSDPSKVHRQEHFGGLGWAMTKKVWERDLKHYSYVKSAETDDAWDSQVAKIVRSTTGNNCIYPEVPRTHHNAEKVSEGNTASAVAQRNWFANMALSSEPEVEFDFDQILNYNALLEEQISNAVLVDCVDDILSYHNQTVVIYFFAHSNTDHSWRQVGEVFDNMAVYANPKPMRTVYKGVLQFIWGTNRVLIVGSYSPFVSKLSDKFSLQYPLKSIPRECAGGSKNKDYWTSPYKEIFAKTIGEPGRSCTETCEASNLKCDVHFFHHLIQEVRAKNSKVDKRCSLDAISGAYPSLTHNDVHVYSSCARWYSCAERPEATFRRICPCVQNILVYQ